MSEVQWGMLRKDDVTLRQTKQIKIKNGWRIDGLEEGGDGRIKGWRVEEKVQRNGRKR